MIYNSINADNSAISTIHYISTILTKYIDIKNRLKVPLYSIYRDV